MQMLGHENNADYRRMLLNVGRIKGETNEPEKQLAIYREVIDNYEKGLGTTSKEHAKIFTNIGFCYRNMKNYDKALEYLNKALSLTN